MCSRVTSQPSPIKSFSLPSPPTSHSLSTSMSFQFSEKDQFVQECDVIFTKIRATRNTKLNGGKNKRYRTRKHERLDEEEIDRRERDRIKERANKREAEIIINKNVKINSKIRMVERKLIKYVVLCILRISQYLCMCIMIATVGSLPYLIYNNRLVVLVRKEKSDTREEDVEEGKNILT